MKPRSIFHTLSPEDSQRVIALCEKHSYKEVLQLIAKPRSEGGLEIQSSESALCRFYVRAHPVAHRIYVEAQLAEALDESFFEHGDVYYRAVIALLQQRLFTELSTEKPLAQMMPLLRQVTSFRRDYLKVLARRATTSKDLDPIPEKYFDPADTQDHQNYLAELQPELHQSATPPRPEPQPPKPSSPENPPKKRNLPRHSTHSTTSTELPLNSTLSTNSTGSIHASAPAASSLSSSAASHPSSTFPSVHRKKSAEKTF